MTSLTILPETMEEKKVTEKKDEGQKERALCPFIRRPFEGCYCTSTSSLYTEATINYCGGDYKKCEIYEKHFELRDKIR